MTGPLSTLLVSSIRALGRLRLNHSVLLSFTTASTVLGLTNMASAFLILRWVPPAQMGLWYSLALVETYSSLVQLGVFNGLNRELPYRLGRRDTQALEFVSTTQGFSLVVIGLMCLGAVASIFVSSDPDVRYVLPLIFLAGACSLYQQFLASTYRAKLAFKRLTLIFFIDSLMSASTLPLVYYLGYAGLPLRYMIVALTGTAIRYVWRPFRVPTKFSPRILVTLLRVGIPLYAFSYILGAAETFPRLVLLSRGTLEMVGLLAPAMAMISLMVLVPSSLTQYAYPHMSYQLGATNDPRSLWQIAWKASFGYMVFAIPILVIGLFLVPPVIRVLLPEYVGGIDAVRWILVAGVFLGSKMSISALNSLKAWRWMSLYVASRALTLLLLPLLFFGLLADKVEGVALGYALSSIACFLVGLMCVHRATIREGTGS